MNGMKWKVCMQNRDAANGSFTLSTSNINSGNHVFLGINTTAAYCCSSGIDSRIDIFAFVISNDSSQDIIGFTTLHLHFQQQL